MTATADPRRQQRFDTYERFATVPLLVNGILFLASFAVLLTDRDEIAEVLFRASWVVFLVDYTVMVVLAPRRWRWITSHLLYLAGLLFPPLRVVLVAQLAYRAATSRNSPLRDRVGLIAIYVTAIIVVFGAYFVWRFEHRAPGATIQTYGEALWWAVVTISTVGYGDYVPITLPGRLIAVLVLVNGLAAIAVITGIVVSFFAPAARSGAASPQESDPAPTLGASASTHTPGGQHDADCGEPS